MTAVSCFLFLSSQTYTLQPPLQPMKPLLPAAPRGTAPTILLRLPQAGTHLYFLLPWGKVRPYTNWLGNKTPPGPVQPPPRFQLNPQKPAPAASLGPQSSMERRVWTHSQVRGYLRGGPQGQSGDGTSLGLRASVPEGFHP